MSVSTLVLVYLFWIDEEGYKYLGKLEHDQVKEKETKTEFVREHKRRIRLI